MKKELLYPEGWREKAAKNGWKTTKNGILAPNSRRVVLPTSPAFRIYLNKTVAEVQATRESRKTLNARMREKRLLFMQAQQ
jgi:hypothetical protein